MSKSSKSNVLFILFLATLILISIFITYLLITNHNNKINNPVNTNKPYYSFQAVSKKDPIDAFAKYPVNPITIDISDKVSISGLKNKEVETKINNKLAKLDSSKNEYGYNFCNVTFNYSNVLGIDCKNEYVMVNLIDGEDIILEEIFQKDSDLFEIIKEALYSSYCAWGTCANREELYEYDSYIDNYLITAIKEIKNREYKICLTNTSLYIYLNYYENIDDILGGVTFDFYNYLNDITIYSRFLTSENIYENEVNEYCNPENCDYIIETNKDYYSNSGFLTSKNYLNNSLFNSTSSDIAYDYRYEKEELDLANLTTKISNTLIEKYNLTKENNYQNIYIDLDIYNTNYDYKLITYIIDIKEFKKEDFIKNILGYYEAQPLKEEHITKNNMIITKDGNIEFLEDNPASIFPDFNTKLYNYILAHEEDFYTVTAICDFYEDYNACLEEYSYEKLISKASYALDQENGMLHMFYQSPAISGMTSGINTYLPLDIFTITES